MKPLDCIKAPPPRTAFSTWSLPVPVAEAVAVERAFVADLDARAAAAEAMRATSMAYLRDCSSLAETRAAVHRTEAAIASAADDFLRAQRPASDLDLELASLARRLGGAFSAGLLTCGAAQLTCTTLSLSGLRGDRVDEYWGRLLEDRRMDEAEALLRIALSTDGAGVDFSSVPEHALVPALPGRCVVDLGDGVRGVGVVQEGETWVVLTKPLRLGATAATAVGAAAPPAGMELEVRRMPVKSVQLYIRL